MWDFSKHGDNIALIQESGNTVTYNELDQYTNHLSKEIHEESLIFCLCSNSLGSIVGYATFFRSNVVPLMLDESIDKQQLDSLIKLYKPDYFWAPSGMQKYFDGLPIIYSGYDYVLIKSKISLKNIRLYKDLALLLTTSGSTGSPKLVRQSYKNIQKNSESIVDFLEIDQNDRAITTLPMSYTYGLSVITTHLLAGASIVLTNKTLVQKEFWTQLATYKATSFAGVPFTYELLSKLKFFKKELPSLKVMTQAGGKLSADLHKKYSIHANETGRRFYVMYGQTEATARMSYLPHKRSVEKIGSIGIAIPNGKLFLIDENNKTIGECGVVGELCYAGENVSLGYAKKPEDLEKADENQGVLRTGDLARFDEDGFYWIVGRKKRFLKVFGNRVSLDETEELLKNKFGELDLACSGVDDKLSVYITDNNSVDEVRNYLSEKTGLNRISILVKCLDSIPKNESGKTIYADLDSSI